jgi:hypothetical protein
LSGRLRGLQPSLLTFFSSGLFLFLFCIAQPVFVIVPILLFARLLQVVSPYSRYFRKKNSQDGEGTTATIRQARWIAGRRRARFRRWHSWLSVVPVFLNASVGDGSTLSSTRFLGGVLDTGAAKSCVGYRQARALCNLTGVPYELSTGTRRFKFGDVVSEPHGILTVPLRTPGGVIPLTIHVVPECASPYWSKYTRCSTMVHQERH